MKKIVLLASLVVSLASFGQSVTGKINFPKGKKLEFETKSNSVISMEMMGQSLDTKVDATVNRMLDIGNVDNGTATIEHKVKRIQFSMDSPMGGSQSFDSEKESDMKSEGGDAAGKMIKNKFTYTVDANGKVLSVTPDDDNPNKNGGGASNDPMSSSLQNMAPGLTLPKVGDISEFHILPNQSLSKGQSWTDTTGGTSKTYTVTDISDNEVTLAYTGTGITNRTQDANGMEITINTTDKLSGTIVLDKATNILKSRTDNTDADGKMEVMGQSVPMKIKSTVVTTVK